MSENEFDEWDRKPFDVWYQIRENFDFDDVKSNKWLANELRKLADHIESNNYPTVSGANLPSDLNRRTMSKIEIHLSHPWGG